MFFFSSFTCIVSGETFAIILMFVPLYLKGEAESWPLKDIYIPTPGTCEYVRLHDKGEQRLQWN